MWFLTGLMDLMKLLQVCYEGMMWERQEGRNIVMWKVGLVRHFWYYYVALPVVEMLKFTYHTSWSAIV